MLVFQFSVVREEEPINLTSECHSQPFAKDSLLKVYDKALVIR